MDLHMEYSKIESEVIRHYRWWTFYIGPNVGAFVVKLGPLAFAFWGKPLVIEAFWWSVWPFWNNGNMERALRNG